MAATQIEMEAMVILLRMAGAYVDVANKNREVLCPWVKEMFQDITTQTETMWFGMRDGT